ncbi:MAG: hypothetical protein AAFN51_06295 [Pseudomonadota bacterium]
MRRYFFAITAIAALLPGVFEVRPAGAQPTCGSTYIIAPGDTLNLIAERVYGPGNGGRLFEANRSTIGNNPNLIQVGATLQLPCFDRAESEQPREANFEPAPELERPIPLQPAGEIVEIVFNKASAPKFIMNVGIIDPFFADIERVTEGRVRFVAPEVINRDPTAQLSLVESGQADGAYMFNGYLTDSHPLLQLTMYPMMGGSALQTAIALWRTHVAHFEAKEQFDGLKLLGFIGAPPAHIWRVSDVPVGEREQLVNNNAWTVPYFEGLDTRGAKTVRAENSERIRLLDETPGLPPATYALAHGAARAVGVWSQARTVTEIDGGVYAPTFSVFIRQEKWDEISELDQTRIEGLLGENLALRSAAWDAFDNGHKAEMLRQGLNIVKPDINLLAELQDRARVSWEQWIQTADESGISGFEAIERFFAEMAKLRQQYPSNPPS